MSKKSLYKIMVKSISAGLITLILMATLPVMPSAAAPITYYVDNTNSACKDTNPGKTPDRPFCKIGKGASVAVAGDTVSVLAGTYAETVKPGKSGSAGLPITFSAASAVLITGAPGNFTDGGGFRITSRSYIVIKGFNINGTADYGVYVGSSDHITISNNHVSYSGSTTNLRPGIYLTGTTDSSIIGNTADHNTSDGIRLNDGSNNNLVEKNISFGNTAGTNRFSTGISVLKNSNNNQIIRNIAYANIDSGLKIDTGSSNNIVANNLFFGNSNHGIENSSSPFNQFIGNTVQGNATSGINIEINSNGATLMNNISVDNGYRRLVGGGTFTSSNPGNIRVDDPSTTGTTIDYDLIYSNTGGVVQITWGITEFTSMAQFQAAFPTQEAHGLQADPLFTAAAPVAERPPDPGPYGVTINNGDYRLTAGSPAIDSANSDAPNEQTYDIRWFPRVDNPAIPNTGAGVRAYDDRGAFEYALSVSLPLILR